MSFPISVVRMSIAIKIGQTAQKFSRADPKSRKIVLGFRPKPFNLRAKLSRTSKTTIMACNYCENACYYITTKINTANSSRKLFEVCRHGKYIRCQSKICKHHNKRHGWVHIIPPRLRLQKCLSPERGPKSQMQNTTKPPIKMIASDETPLCRSCLISSFIPQLQYSQTVCRYTSSNFYF